jgi:hypothetical protein
MVFGSEEDAMTGRLLFGGSGGENILSHYSEPCITAPQLKTKRLSNPFPQPVTTNHRTISVHGREVKGEYPPVDRP